MKILFISGYADAADLALRMKLEGNKIRLWIKDPKYKSNFDGLIDKVDTWQQGMAWNPDLVVFEDNYCPEVWKAVRNIKPCFGGSEWGAKLENDRKYAHSVMNDIGLEKIESLTLKTHADVIAHLKAHKVRHVIKPEGGKADKHHVIISDYENGEDAIPMMERLRDQGIPIEKFEVEERIMGVEVACSVWCAGKAGIVGPTNLNFEHKRLLQGDKGPMTGEAGTLMKYNHDQEHPYFLATLKKIEPLVKKMDYRGQLDLNMIATMDESGKVHYWPLEFTPRLGKPSCFLESELHITPWSELFYKLALGMDPNLQTSFDWCAGVVLFAFGHPFEKDVETVSCGLPVLGVENLDHTHLWNVTTNKKGRLVVGNGQGYILTATGKADSIYEAKARAYDAIRPICVPSSFYRFDICDRVMGVDLEGYGLVQPKTGLGEDLKALQHENRAPSTVPVRVG